MSTWGGIRTPDQRLRVFVSSTLAELAAERVAVRRAVEHLRLTPVMFELGARPHPPRDLYRAYLEQSDVFVGIYWQSYGWVAPGEDVSGLEDEFRLAGARPRLLYVREPAPERQPRLEAMLEEVRRTGSSAYKVYTAPEELEKLVAEDLAVLLTERFQASAAPPAFADDPARPPAPLQPITGLVGREEELAGLAGLLTGGGARIVTLTGPAGIGKSRLALELAHQLADARAGGVWTVLLETVRDPALVVPAIAQALGVRAGAAEEPLAALVRHLADRRALLVLDNLEQVAEAAPVLADLLASCPGVRLLVTSRMPLRLRGEQEWPLDPLAVPDADRATADELAASPAVRLFLARAQAVGAPPPPSARELRDVARICARLDGLPLAIELAAARARLLPPGDLLARLERRLPLLTGGPRDAPARHRTLRAAIDWGHDLLEADEQVALRRLSVFSGGWTMGAGEEVLVAAGPLAEDTLDVVEALVVKGFVARSAVGGPESRLTMLQTMREYAGDKLAAAPDADVTRAAHAHYFLAFAEQAAPATHGPDQVTWLDALERDHANLREALAWFARAEDPEPLLRLAVALGRFWLVHSHLREGLRWLGRARDRSAARRDRLRAEVLSWLGILALTAGDPDGAEAAHTAALPLRRATGDAHGEHIELLSLGNVAYARDDLDTAAARWQELFELAEQRGDHDLRARALSNHGLALRFRGDLHGARAAMEQAIRLQEERGEPHAAVMSELNRAAVLCDLGETGAARAAILDVLVRAQALGDVAITLEGLEVAAAVESAEGRPDDAAWLFAAADALRVRCAAPRHRSEAVIFDRDVGRARDAAARLGSAAAFEAAWAAGTAATYDDAVAFALAPRGGDTA